MKTPKVPYAKRVIHECLLPNGRTFFCTVRARGRAVRDVWFAYAQPDGKRVEEFLIYALGKVGMVMPLIRELAAEARDGHMPVLGDAEAADTLQRYGLMVYLEQRLLISLISSRPADDLCSAAEMAHAVFGSPLAAPAEFIVEHDESAPTRDRPDSRWLDSAEADDVDDTDDGDAWKA
jgi:hypothetical protein